ncbi:MAG: metallophosphoesterase [Verrucomicrobiales bacterium]
MKILVLHLSDIHLQDAENSCVNKLPLIPAAVQNEELELDAAILVTSGDVVYSGTRSQYKIATDLLSSLSAMLRDKLRVEGVRFVFVPGNHDCDFSTNQSVRNIVIDGIRSGKNPDDGMIQCCCEPQTQFFEFRDSFPQGAPDACFSPLHWEYVVETPNAKIQFRCFNTAWMSVLHEKQGGLHFPDSVLQSDQWTEKNDFVVSIFHHPYNWMPPASYRRFRAAIEETSDLILTGHEHEPDHYQKYSFTGEVNEYLEGAVLQEHGHPERAGFHAVYVDLLAQKQRAVSFWWESDRFTPERHTKSWIAYKRGSRSGRRDFILDENFASWLDDPGATYQHPAKDHLSLLDIYVFPNLKPFTVRDNKELVYSSLIEGRDLLKTIGAKEKVFLFGRHQAGKTTLAKILFQDLYNKNFTPVLLDGADLKSSHLAIEKLEALVEVRFQSQYTNPLLPAFQQLDRDKSVVIIDDFDHGHLNSRGRVRLLEALCKRYDRVVIFGDDLLKFEELISGNETGELFADFEQYELVQFGHLLRNKLITQWYSIGTEYDSDPEQLGKRIHQAEQLVNTMLGQSYLPSYPIFVLGLIQAQESVTRPDSSAGTYGSLYEHLITQSLLARSSAWGLDLKLTYLSELAYWMYKQQRKRITDEEWILFHQNYCTTYKIHPSMADLKSELSSKGLFDLRDERYGFRHPASFYYFTARYLRDNLSRKEIRNLVRSLLATLHKEENASIWLFLTHLSKDPFLIDAILTHARAIYSEFPEAEFGDDVSFLREFSNSVDTIVLEDKDFQSLKEERLRRLDDSSSLSAKVEAVEEVEDITEETDAALLMIARMNLAIRTLEVLGQLVKNFPGSLKGTEKHDLIKEAYSLGLRTVSMLFDAFQADPEGLIDFVVDRVIDQHPNVKDRGELKKRVRLFMYWLVEASSLGLVKRISQAVGHSQLGETYSDLRGEKDSNALALIDISIQLDNLGFPEDELNRLKKRFSGNLFCDRVLRQLAVQHFYLFPTKESTKQRVCSTLGIEIGSIRKIEAKSRDQKQIRDPRVSKPK